MLPFDPNVPSYMFHAHGINMSHASYNSQHPIAQLNIYHDIVWICAVFSCLILILTPLSGLECDLMQEQLLSGVGGWIILKIDQACVQHVHGGTMGHPHITSSLPFAYHLKYLMIYTHTHTHIYLIIWKKNKIKRSIR